MLVDSGAEISAISSNYEDKIIRTTNTIPTLPLTGISVYNAIGNKAIKVKSQILLPITIKKKTIQVPFIVIPDLNEGGIIGNDFLETHRATVDYEKRNLTIRTENSVVSTPFLKKEGKPIHLKTIYTKVAKEPIVPKIITHKPQKEQALLDTILEKFNDVFRREPGKIRGYECNLRLKDDKPVCVKPYPIPISKIEAVEREINRMIELDIIERSRSPYSIPIVPVFKKNGEVRLCLDARKINEIIIPDCERPLTIDTILAKFRKVKYMSTLDLRSGYWQVPLAKESRAPCSFLINGKNYSYKRLPFGLNVSGAEFQKSMDMVLGTLTYDFVTIYVDDILITSESIDQHYRHIQEVLERFKKHNITLNLEKCQFFRKEASFLGHIITTDGIKMDPEKTKTIQEFKAPTNRKQLQSYLGFLNFYRRYIKKFAHITEPLLDLVRKDNPWKWENRHQTAFDRSKNAFIEEIITAFPDFSQPLYVNTDASNTAIGGELFQMINGERATLAFASRTLKPAETRYTTTELEALALIYCCTKFRQYLIGHKIILQTDHHALTFIKQCKLTSGRLTRWVLALQEFEFTIQYIPGKLNTAADTLTRYPRTGEERTEARISLNKINQIKFSEELIKNIKNIAKIQEMDENLKKLKDKETDHITTKNNIIFIRRSKSEGWKLAIPSQISDQLTKETHTTMGHPGRLKTYHALKDMCSFRNMAKTVATIVKHCDSCQRSKPINFQANGPATSHKPTKPFETASIDLMGPLPTGRGGTHYILAILDTFSKFIKLYALKKASAKAILNRIEHDYIINTGRPEAILTDNGTQFTGKLWEKRLGELNIKIKHSTKYHPQSNPVERYNREIGRILRTYCHDQHTKWPNYLDQIEDWMNKVRSEVTDMTPWELIKGESPKRPLENLISFPEQTNKEIKHKELVQLAAARIKKKALKQESKQTKKKPVKYTVGQQILTRNFDISNAHNKEIKKLFHIYKGPFTITKIISENTVVIKQNETNQEDIINVSNIRPYYSMDDQHQE